MRPLPQVELEPGTLVIADLHLDAGRGALEGFLIWLASRQGAPRIVILGDLFEYWFGPGQAHLAVGRNVVAALAACTRAGTSVDVVPGNRDFLLGRTFARRSGARVHHGGMIGRLPGGERVLLLHGDELATRDLAYQRMRRVLRSPFVATLARLLPARWAEAAARRLRRTSGRAVRRKDQETTALQESACRALAERHAAGIVACGHAHRFSDRRLDGGPRWLVLDAFGGKRDTLVVAADGQLEATGSRG
jgi:UDP-2,3-diacylglucosamine hydrolase